MTRGQLGRGADNNPTSQQAMDWPLVFTTPYRNKISGAAALQRSPAALLVLRLHQRCVVQRALCPCKDSCPCLENIAPKKNSVFAGLGVLR
jgi:hypothetical protein